MQLTAWSKGLRVTGDGSGVASHAGLVLLRLLADRVGLTGALSVALARRGFWPIHDRGRVLGDVAVMIADGGEAIADIEVLRHQGEVLGRVAAPATVWRTLDGIAAALKKSLGRGPRRGRGRGCGCGRCCRHCPALPAAAACSTVWWCWMWTPRSCCRTAKRKARRRPISLNRNDLGVDRSMTHERR